MFLGRTTVSNFSASKYWVAAVMFVFVWGFNQITGAMKREVGERRSTCFCVVFASANMYNWCSVTGFAWICYPMATGCFCMFLLFFKVPQGCACNASFCRCGAKWSVDSLFGQKWDNLDVMQTRYRTEVDVDINLETNYIDTRFIFACKTLCIQQKSTKYHVTAKASFSSCSRLLLPLDCKTATSKATYT